MTTQVLIINPQLAFTVALKQALERTGSFDVHPFTTTDAALEYLHEHPQDVALIHTVMPGVDAATLIYELRSLQSDLPIVISPQQPENLLRRLNVQGAITPPFSARDVIPLLTAAVEARGSIETPPVILEALPDAGQRAAEPADEEQVVTSRLDEPPRQAPATRPEVTFDDVLSDLNDASIFDLDLDQIQGATPSEDTPPRSRSTRSFDDLVRSMSSTDEGRKPKPLHERTQSLIDFTLPTRDDPGRPRDPNESTLMFRQLAEEEPPMPGLEDGGTVGDLMSGVVDSGFRDVLAILRGDEPPPKTPVSPALSDTELQSVLDSFYEAGDDERTPPSSAKDPFRQFDEDEPGSEGRSTARLILETALDESTPPDQFSIDALLSSIEQQLPEHRPNVRPLPSWQRETEPLIAEPDFLPEEPARVLPLDFTGDLYDQTTRPSSNQHIETRAGDMETELVQPFARAQADDIDLSIFEQDTPLPQPAADADFVDLSIFEQDTPLPQPLPDAAEDAFDWSADEPDADDIDLSIFEQDTPLPQPAAEVDSFEEEASAFERAQADEPPAQPENPEVVGLPEDVDASVAPLLMEKFYGVWDDSGTVETVVPDDAEAWPEPQILEGALDAEAVVETPDEWEAEPSFADPWAAPEALETGADDVLEAVEQGDVDLWPEPVDAAEAWSLEAVETDDLPEFEADDLGWDVPEPPEAPLSLPEPVEEAPSVWMGERLPELPELSVHSFDTALFDTAFDQLAAFDFPDAEVLQLQPGTGARPVDDPRIAQLALSLTHASLESTAEATMLTRHGEIVAFAGDLTREDLEELRRAVSHWDNDIEQAHVGFITLASTGRVVMVYSRQTEGHLALSMVFAGSTPLRDIRRQGKRLLEALESVPEPEAVLASLAPIVELQQGATAPVEAADIGPLVAQGALWVLSDPNAQLDDEVAQAIEVGLRTQLAEQRWRVHSVEARDEYIYVVADMPAERLQPELMADLKQRAATIAAAVDPSLNAAHLWAEGYMMVSPGRPLELDEIQDFINFERM
jgi:DNA-binding NarL/FixJ family response regulator